MAANKKTLDRVRQAFAQIPRVVEKQMFRGVTFMVNGKMCVCVNDGEILCRVDPDEVEEVLERNNCKPMIHNGRVMKGFIFVEEEGYRRKSDFEYFIGLALEFNKKAKASKARAAKKTKEGSKTKTTRNST